MWYCYIIECIGWRRTNLGKIKFYTGETSRDPEIRFNEHCHGVNSSWMQRNGFKPRRLVYVECMPDCDDKKVAMLRERQIKNKPRQWKKDKI